MAKPPKTHFDLNLADPPKPIILCKETEYVWFSNNINDVTCKICLKLFSLLEERTRKGKEMEEKNG